MGISGFDKLYSYVCNKYTKTFIDTVEKNKKKYVVVDTSQILNKYCRGRIKNNTTVINEFGKDITHIYCIYVLTHTLLSSNIIPIYVFEKKSPVSKRKTILQRNKISFNAKRKCSDMEYKNKEYYCHLKKTFRVGSMITTECKHVLDSIGIKYIESVGEADQQCAALSAYYEDKIIGVITDDTDILVFGGNNILKNFSISKKTYNLVNRTHLFSSMLATANKIRENVELEKLYTFSHTDFINFSILMGTDYTGSDGKNCKITKLTIDELFSAYAMNSFDVLNTIKYIKYIYGINISSSYLLRLNEIYDIYTKSVVIDPKSVDLDSDNVKYNSYINIFKNIFKNSKINNNNLYI